MQGRAGDLEQVTFSTTSNDEGLPIEGCYAFSDAGLHKKTGREEVLAVIEINGRLKRRLYDVTLGRWQINKGVGTGFYVRSSIALALPTCSCPLRQ